MTVMHAHPRHIGDDEKLARSARVSHWSPDQPLHDPIDEWLPAVLGKLRRLMRPARTAYDLQATPDAVLQTLNLLSKIMSTDTPPPTVVPRFGGGVQLEWHQNGIDLEIYVDADGSRAAWCFEEASHREWDAEGEALRFSALRKELSLLSRHD
ncbi:hypothetical protein [Nocardioides ganghwensis]|uniref:Uncharacterized protein n=1 Tax=Nocardioides ganghwensis TaxID=252230 RepID=A0A4Q2SHA0_9ACTN|nr:hypothetical protein [Nocardioides ganghwensis]MBD3946481.1 hypothetical protein [Nocardioides ganghwensis]RYC03228.1 hypothetical protein EUA07_06645 [Nocardioides ganghwensis]